MVNNVPYVDHLLYAELGHFHLILATTLQGRYYYAS